MPPKLLLTIAALALVLGSTAQGPPADHPAPTTAITLTGFLIQIIPSILTLAGILIGVWQFNKGQNNQAMLQTLSRFKEMQIRYYTETTSVISYLTINGDFNSKEYKEKADRFWQLYWVELSSVETPDVEKAMVRFGKLLQQLQEADSKNIEKKRQELKIAGYEVSQAIKLSTRTWELPPGLTRRQIA